MKQNTTTEGLRARLGRMRQIAKLLMLLTMTEGLHAFWVSQEGSNVVLVVLDGVRWQDFFKTKEHFKQLWHNYGQRAVVKGNRRQKSTFKTGGTAMSLPSYQRIFTGFDGPCSDNGCERVRRYTFAENLIRSGYADYHDVAVFSSWNKIKYAMAKRPGSFFSNVGMQPFKFNKHHELPENLKNLNLGQQIMQPRWRTARFDQFTFEFGHAYLKKYQPRFMFMALNDADEWAHRFRKREYEATLDMYDRYLVRLMKTLEEMGYYGRRTNVIVTTDHGRGDGKYWAHHGPYFKASQNGWFFALGQDIEANRVEIKRHVKNLAHLRVLIESIFYTDKKPLWVNR